MSITTGAVPLPADVALRIRRRTAAVKYRIDHMNDLVDRDRWWIWYVEGALLPWRVRGPERKAIRLGLADAERTVSYLPFAASCDVLVDLRRRCGRPVPCPDHP